MLLFYFLIRGIGIWNFCKLSIWELCAHILCDNIAHIDREKTGNHSEAIMKKGLILEGGAMRGMFTCGVMDVMMENDIVFDGAVGVSAGAAFGVNYKSKQIGRAIRYNTKFCADRRYGGLYSLLTSGNIYNTDFCYNEVPLKYDLFDFETYQADPMEFFVVCTDVDSGKAVYHKYEGRDDHCFDWIRASASMPVVSQMVEIDGHKYLDGALSDSIPIRFFEREGYDKNVVVLTRPKQYFMKANQMMPLIRAKYRKYPNLVASIEGRHRLYNETLSYISQMERAGKLFVIRPESALPVSRVEKDPKKLRAAYELGRMALLPRVEKLKDYLAHE